MVPPVTALNLRHAPNLPAASFASRSTRSGLAEVGFPIALKSTDNTRCPDAQRV